MKKTVWKNSIKKHFGFFNRVHYSGIRGIICKFHRLIMNEKIMIPKSDLINRSSGFIEKRGWLIQYCFGQENGLEYMDCYDSHRMTSDGHVRIYENGEIKELPTLSHGEDVTELLFQKGFTKFSINMAMQSGLLKNEIE